jgi:receptor protein-tyrosine kinase
VGAFEDQKTLSFPLKDFLGVLQQQVRLITMVALVFMGAGVGFSLVQPLTYEASTTIVIGQEQGSEVPAAGALQGEVEGLKQITPTMAEVITSRTIAESVIQQLGLQMTPADLQENLNAEQVRATQVIEVRYQDSDPARAQRVANAVGDVFSEQISEISPSANAVTATVLDRAELPGDPVGPDPVRYGLLALAIGVMLGIALALLWEYLDDRVKSPEEAEQISGVLALGVVPAVRIQRKAETNDLTQRLVTVVKPQSASAEAYRTLRTNFLHAFVEDNPPRAVVVTSHGPGEGKSTTCANLGVVLAQAGKSTLILDCDLRNPVLHKLFGLSTHVGVVDVLAGGRRLREVWNEPVEGLKVVSAGPEPVDPTELLDSQHFAQFLAGVREEYDFVLLNAPPIGLVSDAAILATQSDGVLLVLNAESTRKVAIRQSIRSLEAVSASVIGTVVVKNLKTVRVKEEPRAITTTGLTRPSK